MDYASTIRELMYKQAQENLKKIEKIQKIRRGYTKIFRFAGGIMLIGLAVTAIFSPAFGIPAAITVLVLSPILFGLEVTTNKSALDLALYVIMHALPTSAAAAVIGAPSAFLIFILSLSSGLIHGAVEWLGDKFDEAEKVNKSVLEATEDNSNDDGESNVK